MLGRVELPPEAVIDLLRVLASGGEPDEEMGVGSVRALEALGRLPELRELSALMTLRTLTQDAGVEAGVRVLAAITIGRYGSKEEAIRFLTELASTLGSNVRACVWAADALIEWGRNADAAKLLTETTHIRDAKSVDWRMQAAMQLAKLAHVESANCIFSTVAMDRTIDASWRVESARQIAALGDLTEVKEIVLSLVKEDGIPAEWRLAAAALLLNSQFVNDTVAALGDSIKTNTGAQLQLSVLLLQVGQTARGLEISRSVIADVSATSAERANAALILYQTGRHEEARPILRSALPHAELSARVLLAHAAQKLGETKLALGVWSTIAQDTSAPFSSRAESILSCAMTNKPSVELLPLLLQVADSAEASDEQRTDAVKYINRLGAGYGGPPPGRPRSPFREGWHVSSFVTAKDAGNIKDVLDAVFGGDGVPGMHRPRLAANAIVTGYEGEEDQLAFAFEAMLAERFGSGSNSHLTKASI